MAKIFSYGSRASQPIHISGATSPPDLFGVESVETQPLFWSVPPLPDPDAVYTLGFSAEAAYVLGVKGDADFILSIAADAAFVIDAD